MEQKENKNLQLKSPLDLKLRTYTENMKYETSEH
jgi:hypothetical protein